MSCKPAEKVNNSLSVTPDVGVNDGGRNLEITIKRVFVQCAIWSDQLNALMCTALISLFFVEYAWVSLGIVLRGFFSFLQMIECLSVIVNIAFLVYWYC